MQEREISLVDVTVEILLRWRMFIIWALCGIVLLGAYSYVSSWRSANAQAAEVEEAQHQLEKKDMQEESAVADPASLEEVVKKLTVEQRRNVEVVVGLEKWLVNHESSVLLQIDANNVQQGQVTFYITSESREQSYSIEAVYEAIVSNGEMVQYMVDQLGMSSDISELISLQGEESQRKNYGTESFNVRVIHYDEKVCSDLTQAVIDFMEEKQVELEDMLGEHELMVVNVSHAVVYDSVLADTQLNLLNNMKNVQNSLLGPKKDFTTSEQQYYELLVKGQITSVASVDTELENLYEIVDRGITVTPGVSVKYALLGMILAVFLYAFYLFVKYILNTKIRATDNLRQLYDIPQLGLIPDRKDKKRAFSFVDRWIESLRNRNKREFTREEAVVLAAVAVKMAAERTEDKAIYLLGCNLKDHALAVCEQIQGDLDKDGIHAVILNNVFYDAAAMKSLENARGAVLVERAGATLYTEIEQELELLKRENINILGGILVE